MLEVVISEGSRVEQGDDGGVCSEAQKRKCLSLRQSLAQSVAALSLGPLLLPPTSAEAPPTSAEAPPTSAEAPPSQYWAHLSTPLLTKRSRGPRSDAGIPQPKMVSSASLSGLGLGILLCL